MVASRGGCRMARGWHYAKLSLYRMPLVYLFLVCVFCYSCSFLFVVFVCLCFSFALIGAW